MHKRGKLWSLWLVPGIGALSLGAAGLALTHPRKTSSADEIVAIRLGELRSQAAESRWLAEQRAAGHVGAVFVREQAAGIARHLEASIEGLRKTADRTSVADAAHAALRVGADVDRALQPLVSGALSPVELQRAESTFDTAAHELARLADRVEGRAP